MLLHPPPPRRFNHCPIFRLIYDLLFKEDIDVKLLLGFSYVYIDIVDMFSVIIKS